MCLFIVRFLNDVNTDAISLNYSPGDIIYERFTIIVICSFSIEHKKNMHIEILWIQNESNIEERQKERKKNIYQIEKAHTKHKRWWSFSSSVENVDDVEKSFALQQIELKRTELSIEIWDNVG